MILPVYILNGFSAQKIINLLQNDSIIIQINKSMNELELCDIKMKVKVKENKK